MPEQYFQIGYAEYNEELVFGFKDFIKLIKGIRVLVKEKVLLIITNNEESTKALKQRLEEYKKQHELINLQESLTY